MSLNISLAKYLDKIKYIIFFLLTCSVSFFIIFFIYNFFLIKNIEVESEKNFLLTNKNEIINKSLLLLDTDKISEKIINENYLVKTAKVEKIWPSKLKITISLYEPCASLIVNNGFFNLSCDGRILQKSRNMIQYLPVINYYQKLNNNSFQTGDWIDYKDIRHVLFFINKLSEISIKVLTVDIKGQDMLVFNLIDDKKVIFSNSKDQDIQDYQLELIIKQFKIEGRNYKKIDLRFDKPIISF
jgi:cell division septal protein FtsQ